LGDAFQFLGGARAENPETRNQSEIERAIEADFHHEPNVDESEFSGYIGSVILTL